MAKMFYSLEEAADKLGGEEKVKELASSGKLQQFRDRDRLMFKRDQVDALLGGGGGDPDPDDDGPGLELDEDLSLEEGPGASGSDQITLDAGSGGTLAGELADEDLGTPKDGNATDEISLDDEDKGEPRKEDARQATGISVFDADELEEQADPMAQTQVTGGVTVDDEELALESVGSGSGLLDLTRESDDTSLGAELLDEIYPTEGGGGGGGSGSATASETFDPTTLDLSDTTPTGLANLPGSSSGLENLEQQPGVGLESLTTEIAEGGAPVSMVTAADPGGNAFGLLTLMFAIPVLVVGMVVAISAIMGVPSDVTKQAASLGSDNLLYVTVGVGLLAPILGGIGNVVFNKR